MSFKRLLKDLAAKYDIPADESKALQDAVTETVNMRVDESTKPLQETIAGLKTEQNNNVLKGLGYSEKQIKILNKVIEHGDDVKFEDAVKKASDEYDIKPTVQEKKEDVKTIDPATPPKAKDLPKEGEEKKTESKDEEFSIL